VGLKGLRIRTTKMILALDLGTNTGWASMKDGEVKSGVEVFKNTRFSGGGMRFLKFERWLDGLVEAPTQIVFEEVRKHRGTDAAHVYGGLLGILTKWCEARSVPYCGVPVGTIKKFWTGKGNAGKDQMIKVAKQRGFEPKDDNEADALAILHYWTEDGILAELCK
jgi:hypothetical protein